MSRTVATLLIVAMQAIVIAVAYSGIDARTMVVGSAIGNLWVFVLPMWRKARS